MKRSFQTDLLSFLCIPLVLIVSSLYFTIAAFFLFVFSIVKLFVEWYHGGRLRIVTGCDSVFLNETQDNHNIGKIPFLFDRPIHPDTIRFMKEFVLNGKNRDGTHIAANLQTITVKKFGYAFRKIAPNFNIDNHFIESPRILRSDLELQDIIYEDNQIEWDKNTPKWKITFYKIMDSRENEESWKQTLMVFTFCHSIGDGFSSASFFNAMGKYNKEFERSADLQIKKMKLVNNFPKAIYNTFCFFPLWGLKVLFFPPSPFFKSNGYSKEISYSAMNEIPYERVKVIARRFGTNAFDVYISCFAAAMHKYIKTSGGNSCGDIVTAFPATYRNPDDPIELGNKLVFIPMLLPIQEMEPQQRLKEITNRSDNLKNSPCIPMGMLIFRSCTLFPVDLSRWLLVHIFGAGLPISIMPQTKWKDTLVNGEVINRCTGSVILYQNSGVFHVIHFKNKVNISLTVNHNVFKNQNDADRFVSYFEEEFLKLEEIVEHQNKKHE